MDQLVIMIHPVLIHPMNMVVMHLEPDSLVVAEAVDAAATVVEEEAEVAAVVTVAVEVVAVAGAVAVAEDTVETKADMVVVMAASEG